MASGAPLPPTEPGDRLAVCDTGAYFVSMNNTFGGPRLPIAWIEEGRARLARRREHEDEKPLRAEADIRERPADGMAGQQQLAGDATLLFYMSEEAQEGRNAFNEKRKPDFESFPRLP